MKYKDLNYQATISFIEELGYKAENKSEVLVFEAEMDKMWDYLVIKGHPLIKNLNDSGINWRDLFIGAVKTLPEQYKKWSN